MATNNFDPTKYGATPTPVFDPTKFGATRLNTPTGSLNLKTTPQPTGFLGKANQVTENISNAGMNTVMGFGSTVAQAGLGLGQLATGAASAISGGIGKLTGDKGLQQVSQQANQLTQAQKDISKGIFQNPAVTKYTGTIPGKIGGFGGDVALIASPTKAVSAAKTAITEAPRVISGLEKIGTIPGVGKALSYATKKVLTALPESGVGAAYGGVKGEDAGKSALTFGALSGLGEVVGDTFQAFKGGLGENVTKALGVRGKMGVEDAIKKIPQATRALENISKMSKDIKVNDLNGVEKQFEPTKANFYETMQAYKQTRDKIYNAYTELAAKAGDVGAKFKTADFQDVIKTLNGLKENATSGWKTKIDSLVKDLTENYGQVDKNGNVIFKDTDLTKIQKFVEKVNIDVNPQSDKPGAEVSGVLSRKLREILDSKILTSTGKSYQKLRNSYSDMKSIEGDLLNQFKKAVGGKGGGWFSNYVEGFGGLDSILGLLGRNPSEIIRGIGVNTLGKIMQHLSDPETYLKRAFDQIKNEGKTPSDAAKRILGK